MELYCIRCRWVRCRKLANKCFHFRKSESAQYSKSLSKSVSIFRKRGFRIIGKGKAKWTWKIVNDKNWKLYLTWLTCNALIGRWVRSTLKREKNYYCVIMKYRQQKIQVTEHLLKLHEIVWTTFPSTEFVWKSVI